MKTALRVLAAATLSAAVLLATAWGSIAPLKVARGDDAIVRISLGARPERIEVCRRQTDEELARLAPQMRQSVVCEGTTARYRLEVRRNGELLHSQVVRGGGLRNDRPLYVSRDLPVPPGPAVFAVRLARIDTIPVEQRSDSSVDDDDDDYDGDGGRAAGGSVPRPGDPMPARARREVDERRRRREESIPAELSLDLKVTLEPREVVLVSYDQRSRRLISVSGDSLP
ncbi:MAG: hypothetical protein NUW01_03990 [Gemmatimonadaceae bacterium]|nr:hypothetical protein [Gemmatimonadaceae bacterium]